MAEMESLVKIEGKLDVTVNPPDESPVPREFSHTVVVGRLDEKGFSVTVTGLTKDGVAHTVELKDDLSQVESVFRGIAKAYEPHLKFKLGGA